MWGHAGQIVQAATDIAALIVRLVNARDVERVAHILPVLRTQLEKARADLKAAIKYGRRS